LRDSRQGLKKQFTPADPPIVAAKSRAHRERPVWCLRNR
jgi:hypothetical protein